MRHFLKFFVTIVLGAAALEAYRGYFFPGDHNHLVSFLVWVTIGIFSSFLIVPWTSIAHYTETITLPDSVEPVTAPWEYKASGLVPTVIGILMLLLGAIFTFLPSYRLISDEVLNMHHGIMWFVLGVGCLSVRWGCRVFPGERRAERWFSVLGVPMRSSVALSQDLQLVLRSVSWNPKTRRQLDTSGTTEVGSLLSDVVLVQPHGSWVLCNGLSFEQASEVAQTLGLEAFVVEGDLLHRGYDNRVKSSSGVGLDTDLDERREKRRFLKEQRAKIQWFMFIATLPFVIVIVVGSLTLVFQDKASQQVVELSTTSAPPPLTRAKKAEAPYAVAGRAYQDSLKADISQADRERFLREASDNLEASIALHVVEPQVYLLRAQVRSDMGMVSEALVDYEKFRELGGEGFTFAYNLRRAQLYEEALAVVEESLTRKAPCEAQVLKALLLFDLDRDNEAASLSYSLHSCSGSPGWDELQEKMKPHRRF